VSELRAAGAGGLPLEQAPRRLALHGARPAAARRQSLQEACAAVEGLFLSQLLSELETPAFGGGLLGQSAAHRLFGAQHRAALGVELGKRCELGLAQMLRSQLEQAMAEAPSSEGHGLRFLPLAGEQQVRRGEEVTRR